jgi:hypothetical protein
MKQRAMGKGSWNWGSDSLWINHAERPSTRFNCASERVQGRAAIFFWKPVTRNMATGVLLSAVMCIGPEMPRIDGRARNIASRNRWLVVEGLQCKPHFSELQRSHGEPLVGPLSFSTSSHGLVEIMQDGNG